MPEHRYEQYCGAARALDVVGDRWTLLIVRELMLGPRRFTDLIDGLPGISRNLLTERLRALECDGVIARNELPPPAARQVYELTEDGRDLADAMVPLVAWGTRRLGARKPSESFRAHWGALAMATFADGNAAGGVSETYQYLVGRTAFHFIVEDDSIQLHYGRARSPVVSLTTDEDTWANIASGQTTASVAAAAGALTVTGEPEAVTRLGKIFSRSGVLAQAEEVVKDARRPRPQRAVTRGGAMPDDRPEPHHSSRGHVVVVGRSPEKMRQALEVLESAGFAATGTFDRDEAMAAITAHDTLFAVVAGGSVGRETEAELHAAAEARGGHVVRANIGDDDPTQHFIEYVLPQLAKLQSSAG